MNKIYKASATVEALLIMPVAIMFMSSVIWLIAIFGIHSQIGKTLFDIGNDMVAYSYPYSVITEDFGEGTDSLVDLAVSVIWSETAIRASIESLAAGRYITGLSCILSTFDTDGNISLKVTYRVKPFISIPGYNGMILTNSYYSKAYTGSASAEESEIVYITKGTEIYHTDRSCSAIIDNTRSVLFSQIGEQRNLDRGKYYPCSTCIEDVEYTIVYVTGYGNRYHGSLSCPNISTSVYTIPLSETGDRRKCMLCP